MPKISAPTVREHHEIVKERLVDATERILRESGVEGLSAGAVAAEAGIARNSIYRYVDSVDDLRLLMLARYMPRWREAVFADVDMTAGPEDRLVQFMVSSLRQTGESSHQWLMSLMRSPGARRASRGPRRVAEEKPSAQGGGTHEEVRKDIASIHQMIEGFMREQWEELGVANLPVWGGFAGSLLFESFKQVERGADLQIVCGALETSVRSLIASARAASA